MFAALIDTNPMQPPVAPIGLDYLAEALHAAGHAVGLLGLCREDDPGSAIARFFKSSDFNLVGMTLRNTDDCAFTSWRSFTPEFVGLVEAVREDSSAPIVLGRRRIPGYARSERLTPRRPARRAQRIRLYITASADL